MGIQVPRHTEEEQLAIGPRRPVSMSRQGANCRLPIALTENSRRNGELPGIVRPIVA